MQRHPAPRSTRSPFRLLERSTPRTDPCRPRSGWCCPTCQHARLRRRPLQRLPAGSPPTWSTRVEDHGDRRVPRVRPGHPLAGRLGPAPCPASSVTPCPLALDVAVEVAKHNGVCIRPIELRRLDTHTGTIESSTSPAGPPRKPSVPPVPSATASCAGPSAGKAGTWITNRSPNPDPSTEEQRWLMEFRADMQANATRPSRTAKTPPTGTRPRRASMRRSTRPGCGATSCAAGRLPSAPARPGGARMLRTCPSGPAGHHPRADLHRLRWEGLPAVAVRHAHASLVRQDRSGQGVPVDPSTYDYARGGSRRAALLQARRPVRAEPAPGGRL